LVLIILGGFVLFLVFLWFWLTQPLLSSSAKFIAPPVSPARLETHVRALAVEFTPRDHLHPENLDRAAAYIHREFEQAQGITVDAPYQIGGKNYRNVSAVFGPDTPERIVVGAHYDSAGPLPAADDNASGVAGLIELAYLLGEHPPAIRVELVAYTLEEPPYFHTAAMGSAHHAQGLKAAGVKVRMMLSLEMIGYFSDASGSQLFPSALLRAFYPSTGNFISIVGSMTQGFQVRRVKAAMRSAAPLRVYSINAPSLIPGVDFSDHLNYWNAGYPALMITDTAFYRNTAYHTPQDTPDRLNYQRMAMVVQGVYAAILELSK
jgi:Zn-dependent M28 family amino/carboxypeptidase